MIMMTKKIAANADSETGRLETPRAVGYRSGMTSSGVIGRKLGHLYAVPADMPDRIDELLQVLERHGDE